jgi:hypothetical protein
MDRREALEARRETLLEQMRSTRSMKRGTLSIRPEKVRRQGRKEPVLLGPYPLFVRREGTRTVGRRLGSPQEVAQVREDIAAYDRFMALCKEFAEATEALGELERAEAASDEALEKGRGSRSNRVRKSRGS